MDYYNLIKNYLDSKDELSLEIDGAWGSGKTYFIKDFIQKYKQVTDKTVVYISVNGLPVDEISQEILNTILQENAESVDKKSKSSIAALLKHLKSFKNLVPNINFGGLSVQIPFNFLDAITKKIFLMSDTVFIIDDVERLAKDDDSLSKLFGFISTKLLEEKSKVIIIVNELELENKKFFFKNREKIVNNIIRFSNNTQDIFLEMAKSYDSSFEEKSDFWNIIKNELFLSGNADRLSFANLRTMKLFLMKIIDIRKEIDKSDLIRDDLELFYKQLTIELYGTILAFRSGNVEFKALSDKTSTTRRFSAGISKSIIQYVITGEVDVPNIINTFKHDQSIKKQEPNMNTLTNFRKHSDDELKFAESELFKNIAFLQSLKSEDIVSLVSRIEYLENKGIWLSEEKSPDVIDRLFKILEQKPRAEFEELFNIPFDFMVSNDHPEIKNRLEKLLAEKKSGTERIVTDLEKIKSGQFSTVSLIQAKEDHIKTELLDGLLTLFDTAEISNRELNYISLFIVRDKHHLDLDEIEMIKNRVTADLTVTTDNVRKFLLKELLAKISSDADR